MPQSTNLNVNPYYSDFNDEKNYYKVLFKPGVSVQTRELNNLQDILQNQIEKFGSSFYSQGGMVIPGNYAYDNAFSCVEVEDTYSGVSVETYFRSLIGKKIKGKNTNITAVIDFVLGKDDPESTRKTVCIYVKYKNSSSNNFSTEVFDDGEDILLDEDVLIGETLFTKGQGVFKAISPTDRKSTSVGSCTKIEDGVYFVRGFFVNVESGVLILDPYTNTPSYRVGLQIVESIIDSNADESLVDNAKGFSNYTAPGADRLQIKAFLTKKGLDDFDDDNFVELFKVENGLIKKIIKKIDNGINDILARRTYDESGNYYVNPYSIESLESLNDNVDNNGLYFEGEKTPNGTDVSNDLAVLKISPGKSYIKGYEVPTSTNIVDYVKPRDTKNVESSASIFTAGNVLKVNNINGAPKIGLTTNYTVTLYSSRLNSSEQVGSATSIGFARVYDFEYENTSYVNEATLGNLYLFDIQTFTDITLSDTIPNLAVGHYVEGQNSGASGYVRKISGTSLSLYQTEGRFQINESLSASGIGTTTIISELKDYSIDFVKSISDNDVFNADIDLSKQSTITGPLSISITAGIGTITKQDGTNFASNILVNDIISYSRSGIDLPVYAEVQSINPSRTSITVTSIADVSNVCSGTLGISTTLQSIKVLRPETFNNENSSLYSQLEKSNISEVGLENSNLYVKKEYIVNISSNSLTLPNLQNTDYVYTAFDEENYILIDSLGENINLSTAVFSLNPGNKSGSITSIDGEADGDARLIVTLQKSNITSKYKKLERCKTVTLTRTKNASANGLTLSRIYGTRVEDPEISLNYPDIFQVHAVLQSTNTSNPVFPNITISGLNTSEVIIGELIKGKSSGAVAVCVSKPSSTRIDIIYKNKNKFTFNETVEFLESDNTATVTVVNEGDTNILSDFILDNGQREQFYDIGRLVRKSESREPSRRITVVFDYFRFESTDNGDVITVNSYPPELYGNKIPLFEGVRNTDVIDIRPRVSDYNTSSTLSPFDFNSRNFSVGSNNSTHIVKSNESMIFDYSFYLPRTDKLTLSKDGTFNIVYGKSAESPSSPKISNEVLDVATLYGSAYVYDVSKDIRIDLTDNRRYTMSDLRDIEKRVENLEYYTSLSLLELSTESLLVTDSEGLNRFKSGFFVDNFGSYNSSDLTNVSYQADISNNELKATTNKERVSLVRNTLNNLKVTGNTITLDYDEVEYAKQPFASRIINVNPFNVVTWTGKLELSPSSDYWTVPLSTTENVADFNRRGTTNTIVTRSSVEYIRSRNIKFTGTRLKPTARFDFYFDSRNLSTNQNGSTFAFPKLLEISNVTGSFAVGETVNGFDNNGNRVRFKICAPNHKSGPINNPTFTYNVNPYQPNVGLSSTYGTQSTVLNVDVDSLQISAEGEYFGNILSGMILYGQSSNATATVSNIRLVSDDNGTVIGSLFIPNPQTNTLKYRTGNTTAKITLTQTAPSIPGQETSSAEATFTSSGENVITRTINYYDPLAQTFFVDEDNGIFPTSVDVYFQSKDDNIPVTLQIREVSSGIPGGPDKIVGTLEKVLNPDQVNVSNDSSVKTTFRFDNLTRLEGNREYALVLLSDSNSYNVWISRVGEVEITTANLPEIQKVIINKQPSLGSLFKSQNGSTWTPLQSDDLKFTIKNAKFTTNTGKAVYYNSNLTVNSSNNRLPVNPVISIPNTGNGFDDGTYILVNHPNHGLYSENNKLQISGVFPTSLPKKLQTDYLITSTSPIQVDDASVFTTYYGSPVEELYPGFVLINEEIISYTGVNLSNNTLTGITRATNSSTAITHLSNSLVYKYEFNGIPLTFINKEFDSTKVTKLNIDQYYVRVLESTDEPKFTTRVVGGGSNVYASSNIQFSTLEFDDNFVTRYDRTNIQSSVRTVSSTSVDGQEVSFGDNGFEPVGISSINKFTNPRMVCSRVNELEYLPTSQFTLNKSFTLELTLNTEDTNVSPIISEDNPVIFLENNRIDQPINVDSYTTDSRSNLDTTEPNSFVYVSKKIDLEESASSLKVILSAYRHVSSDIRVLYKIFRNDGRDNTRSWILFPGYLNNNDGRPDTIVSESLANQFKDYTFTDDDTTPFTSFAIKIIGSSTNQAFTPIIKDLRVIALR